MTNIFIYLNSGVMVKDLLFKDGNEVKWQTFTFAP
jgi:hypothetical protein